MSGPTKHEILLVRHGETEWSLSGQHTSHTDLPLTENGRRKAGPLRSVLAERSFALVLCSPLRRARETCELAGLRRPRRDRRRPARVGLRRVRGPDHAADPRDAAGLEPVDRRLSGRRIARRGGRACRPCDRAASWRRRRRDRVRARPHPAGARGAVDGDGSDRRGAARAVAGDDLHARVRARDAGDPELERHALAGVGVGVGVGVVQAPQSSPP